MNGGLQELVDLYLYRNPENNEPMCEVYFKGRLYPFDTVNAGQLFGDLVHLAIQQRLDEAFQNASKGLDFKDLLPALDDHLNNEIIGNISDVLDVAKVIYGCNWEFSALQEWTILSYLNVLDKNAIPFSKDVFNAFIYTYSTYIPPCTRRELSMDFIGKFPYEKWGIDDYPTVEESILNIIKDADRKNYFYHYECDTLQEIFMSVLHFFAMEGFVIKKCERCSRWFVIKNKTDEKYCIRAFGEKTCRELATAEKRRNRILQSPLTKKYNSVNTNLANRANATNIAPNEREKRLKVLYKLRDEWPQKREALDSDTLREWLESFKVGGENNAET